VTDALFKNKIVFVPGKNPKPRPQDHRILVWRCLLRGVELVDPVAARELASHPESLSIAAWNAMYYARTKDVDEDVPWIEALCRKTGPDATDVRDALSWRNKRARLLFTLADLFPALIPLLPDPAVKSTIRETERYFNDTDGIGARVRELLKASLREMFARDDRVLLIGHSMGSVIAYDALWELTHRENNPAKVDLLLTIGSPLGMHFVQKRLLGFHGSGQASYPANIRRWINISAEGDLTALDPVLGDDFQDMVAQGLVGPIEDRHSGVFNYFRNESGLNAHRSYGYLVEQHVARAVLSWWRGDGAETDAAGG
jgi:hypothetical protein